MPIGEPDILEIIANPEHFLIDYPLYRWYKGIIEDVADPENLGRVRVRIEEIWKSIPKCPAVPATAKSPGKAADDLDQIPTECLPWADILIHGQGKETGFFNAPTVGTAVVVVFEKGLEQHPLVIGGWWGTDEIPKAALGGDQTGETANALKGKDGVSPNPPVNTAGGGTIQEPANPYAAVYPQNCVFRSSSGHLVEFDNTENKERINIAHKSGSWAEFHPDGTLVFGIQGKRYTVVETDDALHVKGKRDVVVDGNATQKVAGDVTEEVAGKQEISSTGDTTIKSEGAMKLQSTGGKTTIKALSTVETIAPQVNVSSTGTAGGNVVTTLTHPFDFVTGIPITGLPNFKAGP